MNTEVYKYLSNYSQDANIIDRLITTTFIRVNDISLKKNRLLKTLMISPGDSDWKNLIEFSAIWTNNKLLLDFEQLIELFEFVISPSDKEINGAVYTPAYIRNYIINESYRSLKVSIDKALYADFSCGCGAFLFSLACLIREKKQVRYETIFPNLYGLDITAYSINRTKILLSLLAVKEGEDEKAFSFNLYCGNALSFDFKKVSNQVGRNDGFDAIVGNPPYVCSRNMDKTSLELLKKWSVTKSGHPDLYIPFFQIGYENLAKNGILGLITVNTFIKSINGRALRSFFAENNIAFRIINFGGEQVFKDKNTYTCLCFLQKRKGSILYKRTTSYSLQELNERDFLQYEYQSLNHHNGWNLVDSQDKNDFINKIELIGKPFKDLFETRNGIATLKNDVYKFSPIREDRKYYYMIKDSIEYPIEKGICRRIVNANKIKTTEDLVDKEEKIIFPYIQKDNEIFILPEEKLIKNFPKAFFYLGKQRKKLDKRDKGNVKKYEAWYAYGRRQSMDTYAYKLFFPHICERPTFVISKDPELLFYNGIAVINDSLQKLIELKSLLESDVFFEYIRNTTKDYSSGYISLSRNYLKNFGIPKLTTEERNLLKVENANHSQFWEDIYEKRAAEMVEANLELV